MTSELLKIWQLALSVDEAVWLRNYLIEVGRAAKNADFDTRVDIVCNALTNLCVDNQVRVSMGEEYGSWLTKTLATTKCGDLESLQDKAMRKAFFKALNPTQQHSRVGEKLMNKHLTHRETNFIASVLLLVVAWLAIWPLTLMQINHKSPPPPEVVTFTREAAGLRERAISHAQEANAGKL